MTVSRNVLLAGLNAFSPVHVLSYNLTEAYTAMKQAQDKEEEESLVDEEFEYSQAIVQDILNSIPDRLRVDSVLFQTYLLLAVKLMDTHGWPEEELHDSLADIRI